VFTEARVETGTRQNVSTHPRAFETLFKGVPRILWLAEVEKVIVKDWSQKTVVLALVILQRALF
jgi:hypothetical protein